MGERKQQTSKRHHALHERSQGTVDLGINNDLSTKSTSDGDSGMDVLRSRLEVGEGRPENYASAMYRKHAEVFPEKFRVSIDYCIREKPQQLMCSFTILGIVVLMACGPNWIWGTEDGNRIFGGPLEELSEQSHQQLRFHSLRVLGCLAVAIMGYCFLESRDGLLVRPHPGLWRLVHGLCFAYFLFLIVLFALHRDDGRFLIRLLVPGIGPKKENIFSGTLVLDCSLGIHTLKRQLTSVWFISHAVGWFLKMCIFRSWMFNLAFSILFEFSEMSLQWLIPEFQECWWDSIFIDAILSNLTGMIVGCAVMRWCGKRHFDWLGAYPTYQKILLKFTPFSSYTYQWSFFRTPRHLLMTSLLLLLALLTEVNVFLLMTVLDIPAAHWINPLRLGLLALLAFPSVAEFYEQVHFRYDRVGGSVFLFVLILIMELLLSIKYGVDRFYTTSPNAGVVVPWVLAGVFFGIWCRCYFARGSEEQKKENTMKGTGKGLKNLQDGLSALLLKIPPQACFLPLLYLSKNYYYGKP